MAPFNSLLVNLLLNFSVVCGQTTIRNTERNEVTSVLAESFGIKIDKREVQIPMFLIPVIFFPFISMNKIYNHKAEVNKEHNGEEIIRNELLLENINQADNDNDIETNFRQSLDRGNKGIQKRSDLTKINREIESNISSIDLNNNMTNFNFNDNETVVNTTGIDSNTTESVTVGESTQLSSTINEQGNEYTTLVYDNKDIESLTLTVQATDECKLPPVKDERWKKFALNNTLENEPEKSTDSPLITDAGSYPSALYNGMIDQVSITTNQYTNGKSPSLSQVDGWDTISSLTLRKLNGFKPLAGLYYDGFLDIPPVKLPGFKPYFSPRI